MLSKLNFGILMLILVVVSPVFAQFEQGAMTFGFNGGYTRGLGELNNWFDEGTWQGAVSMTYGFSDKRAYELRVSYGKFTRSFDRDEVETRNIADSLAYNADKLVRENKDKISDELQQEINEKTTTLRSALQGEDMDAIKSAISDLQESLQTVGEAVYQQQQQEAQAAAPGDGPVDDSTGDSSEQATEESDGPSDEEKPTDDTVEGEFREV